MAKLDSINYKGTLQEIVPEIAPLFKTTEAYSAGDHVIHDAQWYTFKEDKAAGAWDDTKVDGPFTVSEKISELKEDLTATNAELADVRVGADGVTYGSAGAAVRGQINGVKDELSDDIDGVRTDLETDISIINEQLYTDGDEVSIQKNTNENLAKNKPSGYIHVKSTDDSIYTGTINNIDLVGLAQGTFTDNTSGVTIEISGNEIYIHGDTTSGFRFNPQTGEFFTDSFTNHPADYSNLPDDSCEYNYCWWEKTGYTLPNNVYFAVLGSNESISPTALNGHSKKFYTNIANQYVAIYSNGAITGLNAKFTIGLKIASVDASQGASIEQVAKTDYNTKIITKSGHYKLSEFTWTGANTVCDVVSTTPSLKPDPLTNNHVYAWFGDSISQLKELPNLVADLLNVTVHDCTFAGAPLTYGDPTKYQPTGFMSLCSQIVAGDFSDLSDAIDAQEAAGTNVTEKRMHLATLQSLDFDNITDIVVFAGTNDFDNDYVNATKFVNGFSSALETLLTEYPHLMIYVFSPIWRGDKTEGVVTIPTMPDLVGLEKEVADTYCLPFYDLYHRSGINALTASVYLQSDILHPSDAGDQLLANKCAKFLHSN